MRVLRQPVAFEEEVLRDYKTEHHGFEGYDIGLEYLRNANARWQGKWTLVLLSATDIASVLLPWHNHPIEVIPQSGLPLFAAVQRFQQLPKEQIPNCWERISKIKDRDFSQMHIALQMENGILTHVDGVHRLLAYGLFNKDQDVFAYVAGL